MARATPELVTRQKCVSAISAVGQRSARVSKWPSLQAVSTRLGTAAEMWGVRPAERGTVWRLAIERKRPALKRENPQLNGTNEIVETAFALLRRPRTPQPRAATVSYPDAHWHRQAVDERRPARPGSYSGGLR
jgi:hypothetical protein